MTNFAPINLLRKAYVRLANRRFADRYFRATFKLLSGPPYATLLGCLNASDIARGAAAPSTVAYTPRGGAMDFAAFLVHMASRCRARPPAAAAIDIVINASANDHVAQYASLARMLHGRINLHFAWGHEDAERILSTLADAASMERLRSDLSLGDGPIVIDPNLIGRIQPRQFHANQAREFLKARGWVAYYCALSLPDEWPAEDTSRALSRIAVECPDWRFVLLGASVHLRHQPNEANERLILPCYAGVEFSTQMALAMECDAFFGQRDHFGVAAVLGGKIAAITGKNAGDGIQVGSFKNVRSFASATAVSMASDLISVLRSAQDGAHK